jgi:hypothetical protein
MRPLAIGEEERSKLKAMKAFALAHPLTMEQLKAVGAAYVKEHSREYLHPPEQYVQLPVGFEVGLTYELQEKPVWHLSISVDAPGRTPHPAAVDLVLHELGLPPLHKAIACEMYGEVVNLWFVGIEPNLANN